MKKNSCTPIYPKKYSCFGLKKIHTRNLITKKNSCGSKIPVPPPPITFLMVRPLLHHYTVSGVPSESFLLNSLKTRFRLFSVLLDLQKYILSSAINLYLFGHFRATWVFSKLQGLQQKFPENFRFNLKFYGGGNFSDFSVHHIFESENVRISFSTKTSHEIT